MMGQASSSTPALAEAPSTGPSQPGPPYLKGYLPIPSRSAGVEFRMAGLNTKKGTGKEV
jgi:hypothetical protein